MMIDRESTVNHRRLTIRRNRDTIRLLFTNRPRDGNRPRVCFYHRHNTVIIHITTDYY